ncbi:MAG: hypothetical protein R3C53_13905 [Pirellulaceae bacterium]
MGRIDHNNPQPGRTPKATGGIVTAHERSGPAAANTGIRTRSNSSNSCSMPAFGFLLNNLAGWCIAAPSPGMLAAIESGVATVWQPRPAHNSITLLENPATPAADADPLANQLEHP